MKAGLALGSNLGDRLLNLRQARAFLSGLSAPGQCLASAVYETEPVNCPFNSPKFLNAVIEIETDDAPHGLLRKIQAYEAAHGRERVRPINAPRTIDLDILYCGAMEIREKDLTLPHPRLAQRRFVLLPLSTIRADLLVAGTGKTVKTLLGELPNDMADVILVYEQW